MHCTLSFRPSVRGLPDGEDHIPLRSLVLDTIPECDGQTDGFTVAYTALAKPALRRAVKIVKRVL